jgi:formylglycine-generating enzyme required for sulfatase activity
MVIKTKTPTASKPGAKVRFKPPDMVTIPAGEFWMGVSSKQIDYLLEHESWAEDWYHNNLFQVERPYHRVHTGPYEIGRAPVSNMEYHLFVWETGYRTPNHWVGFHYNEEEAHCPVVGVSRYDALAYCEWLAYQMAEFNEGDTEEYHYRLPTEAEWERAARGADGRLYPWGNDFDPWRCNTAESAKGATTPANSYSPSGDSPFGVTDMAGNVWEWTGSVLKPYPYKADDGREALGPKDACVIRGGAWYYSHKLARCAARESVLPGYISSSLGFRIARTITDG